MVRIAGQRIKALFFDIDDTLYSTSQFANDARNNSIDAMIKLGMRCDREYLRKELDEIVREFSSNYEHHFDKLLLRIPRETYEGINRALLVASAVIAYHQTKFTNLKPR